jgi:hypothetical protein
MRTRNWPFVFGGVAPFLVMFFLGGVHPLAAQAHPDRGCHTCFDEWVGPMIEDWEHWFELDGCGGVAMAQVAGLGHPSHCSVCGFSSDCHEDPQPNVCHLTCLEDPCNPHIDPGCDVNLLAFAGEPVPPTEFVVRLADAVRTIKGTHEQPAEWMEAVQNVAGAIRHAPGLTLGDSAELLNLRDCSGRVLAHWTIPPHARSLLVAAIVTDE